MPIFHLYGQLCVCTLRRAMDTNKRWIGVALALIAFGLIAGGAQTHSWWTGSSDGGSVGIGMRDVYLCLGDRCSAKPMGSLGPEFDSASWYRAGMASSAGALLACALLLALGGALVFGKRNALLAKTVVTACGAAAVAGIVYVVLFPGHPNASMGHSVLLYFGGTALGIAAGVTAALAAKIDVKGK